MLEKVWDNQKSLWKHTIWTGQELSAIQFVWKLIIMFKKYFIYSEPLLQQ